jgi:hypothetical protein
MPAKANCVVDAYDEEECESKEQCEQQYRPAVRGGTREGWQKQEQ